MAKGLANEEAEHGVFYGVNLATINSCSNLVYILHTLFNLVCYGFCIVVVGLSVRFVDVDGCVWILEMLVLDAVPVDRNGVGILPLLFAVNVGVVAVDSLGVESGGVWAELEVASCG